MWYEVTDNMQVPGTIPIPKKLSVYGTYSCDWTGTPGQPLTDENTWSCCSAANKCSENEGDCDSNEDCEEGLFCGTNNCKSLNTGNPFPTGADCCVNSTLRKSQFFFAICN